MHRSIFRRHRRLFSAVAVGAVGAVVATALVGLTPAGAADAGTLLSQGKNATASSTENPDYTRASAAFDGNLTTTRWSSDRSDDQWLEVDLGAPATVTSVVLRWEDAYASSYRLEVSDDGVTWKPGYATTNGAGGVETDPVPGVTGRYVKFTGVKRATGYGYSLWEMQVYGTAAGTAGSSMPGMSMSSSPPAHGPNLDPGESITVNSGTVVPSTYVPPPGEPTHHEFQANCSVTNSHPDDPIVFPSQPGASHSHTFLGNSGVTAYSTTGSLTAGSTNCTVPTDKSGYWFPTMYNGDAVVLPTGPQVIYYKSGVADYTSVRAFPRGLRFVVGDMHATESQFQQSPGAINGWECGDSNYNWDFPTTCAPGSELNIRYQAPSCWDGIHLDVPDHRSHMAYPVDGHCTTDHPVAVPMLEFKTAFPVSGEMSKVRLASGRGYSWHYDFFAAWDAPVLNALVKHCIDGGLQCNPRGFDQYKPDRGYALDENYQPLVF